MNYILAWQDCVEINTKQQIKAKVWYEFLTQDFATFLFENGQMVYVLPKTKNENVCCFSFEGDVYFIIFPPQQNNAQTLLFKTGDKNTLISLCNTICISQNDKVLLQCPVKNLKFVQQQCFKDFYIFYFEGECNYVVIFKKAELVFAGEYDEINAEVDELVFLTKLKDALNHGRVVSISEKKTENYLVYLDKYDLQLKPEFVAHVFLDCVLAKNFNYATSLLTKAIKPTVNADVGKFFPEFNSYIPICNNKFCLLNFKIFVCVVSFEVLNKEICNITIQ